MIPSTAKEEVRCNTDQSELLQVVLLDQTEDEANEAATVH